MSTLEHHLQKGNDSHFIAGVTLSVVSKDLEFCRVDWEYLLLCNNEKKLQNISKLKYLFNKHKSEKP